MATNLPRSCAVSAVPFSKYHTPSSLRITGQTPQCKAMSRQPLGHTCPSENCVRTNHFRMTSNNRLRLFNTDVNLSSDASIVPNHYRRDFSVMTLFERLIVWQELSGENCQISSLHAVSRKFRLFDCSVDCGVTAECRLFEEQRGALETQACERTEVRVSLPPCTLS
jgi:hypothetical protein